MTTKTDRAVEIHRTMTPHQMALRIVEIEDIAEIVGQLASERSKRITELQDALELAEEAVRAKHFPGVGNMVPGGWVLVPVEPTIEMVQAATHNTVGFGTRAAYQAMLAAAPKPEGGAAWNNAPDNPECMTMERFVDQYCCVFNASDETNPQGGAA